MKFSWFTGMAFAAASLIIPATGPAQSDARYRNVVILQVKDDMRGEWEALQKEYVAARAKKGGFPSRDVWQVVRGDSSEYHIVTPLEKFADLDQAGDVMDEPDWSRWIARVTKCVDDRRVLTIEYQSHLSIPPKPGRVPKLLQLARSQVAAGRAADYAEYREKVMLPAYRKAGFDGLSVYRTLMGDSRNQWVIALRMDSWAEFDGPSPIERGLGETGFQAMVRKLGEMTVDAEWLVLQHRPDLSYNPD